MTKSLSVLACAVLAGSLAFGQAQKAPTVRTPYLLLHMASVQRELSLSPEAARALATVPGSCMALDPAPLSKLTAGQKARLQQLSLQFDGPLAWSDPQVAQALSLTAAQKASLDRLVAGMSLASRDPWTARTRAGMGQGMGYGRGMGAGMGMGPCGSGQGMGYGRGMGRGRRGAYAAQGLPAWADVMAEKQEASARAVSLLTPAQKSAWTKLTGKALDQWDQPRPLWL